MSTMFCTRRTLAIIRPGTCTILLMICSALTVAGCGTSLTLTSQWADPATKVDGSSSDWNDFPTRIAGPDVYVGVKNDSESLYLCLTTASRSTQFQMLALGTTVWLDPEGKKNKTLGIRFPVPGLSPARRFPASGSAEDTRRSIERLITAAQNQFEIIGPNPEHRKKYSTSGSTGIDVHLGYDEGTLIYEMKIPLIPTPQLPHTIGVNRAKPFTLGLETGDFADAMRAQMGVEGAPAGGGGRGGRGGRGGGGGAAPGIAGAGAPEGLKHWLTVHLQADVPASWK